MMVWMLDCAIPTLGASMSPFGQDKHLASSRSYPVRQSHLQHLYHEYDRFLVLMQELNLLWSANCNVLLSQEI